MDGNDFRGSSGAWDGAGRSSSRVVLAMLLATTVILLAVVRDRHPSRVIAGEPLTAAERVAVVQAALQAAADGIEPAGVPKGKVTLSGLVVDADGKPAKVGGQLLYFHCRDKSPRGFTDPDGSGWSEPDDGEFSQEVRPGTNWLMFVAKRTAPIIAGPFTGTDGDVIDDIKLVMHQGVSIDMRVTDADGQPVAKPRVKPLPFPSEHADYLSSITSTRKGDADGLVHLKRLTTGIPYEFVVTAKGFVPLTYKVDQITADQVLEVKLQRAIPATGLVVTTEGVPVKGAKVSLVAASDGTIYMGGLHQPILAETDAQGRFALDELKPGFKYDLRFYHAAFGCAQLSSVAEGDTGLSAMLAAPLHIAGRVEGDLKRLKYDDGLGSFDHDDEPVVRLEQQLTGACNGTFTNSRSIDAKQGGTFEFKDLLPGSYTLKAGRQEIHYTLTESVDDVVIKLVPDPGTPPRQVVVTFTDNGVPLKAEGHLSTAFETEDHEYRHNSDTVPIKDGVATFEMDVATGFQICNVVLPGYYVPYVDAMEVAPGPQPVKITQPVEPGGAIRLTVLEADGSPVTSDEVWGHVSSAANHERVSNLFFEFGRVNEQGELMVSPLPLDLVYEVSASRGGVTTGTTEIQLTAAAPIANVVLRLPRAVEVVVYVQDENGAQVAGMPLNVNYQPEPGSHGRSDGAVTDFKGRAVLQVNAEGGVYTVSARPANKWRPEQAVLNRDGKPNVLKLRPGLAIEGVVKDADGKPLAGVEVAADLLDETDPNLLKAFRIEEQRTNSVGRFRFRNVEAGKYQIGVDDENFTAPEAVQAGHTEPVVIQAKN